MKNNNQGTADTGRLRVVEALAKRGVEAKYTRKGHRVRLEIQNPKTGKTIHLWVKSRKSGTWQSSTNFAEDNPQPTQPETFWVFVDLEVSEEEPDFYIVPDTWMRRDIFKNHQEYLSRHGGVRAVTLDSTHHAIQPNRVKTWKDRWDILGL